MTEIFFQNKANVPLKISAASHKYTNIPGGEGGDEFFADAIC